ncbi:hypothetical protein XELAEV_18041993mg [Xenopus laevis]|uniref:Uncharacterized protein n=1 Tax=Xenopus laevis TaxID=8355 RepID=A0A974H5Y4_XENLA|nr:hypothetical protein XELAEV_18041993mg [Xenopus laevis]
MDSGPQLSHTITAHCRKNNRKWRDPFCFTFFKLMTLYFSTFTIKLYFFQLSLLFIAYSASPSSLPFILHLYSLLHQPKLFFSKVLCAHCNRKKGLTASYCGREDYVQRCSAQEGQQSA